MLGKRASTKVFRPRGLGPKSDYSGAATGTAKRAPPNNLEDQFDEDAYMDLAFEDEEPDEAGTNMDAEGLLPPDMSDEDMDDAEEVDDVSLSGDETMAADFEEYCKGCHKFGEFDEPMKKSLGLMHLLRCKKASLDTFDAVLEWHLKATGVLHPWETLSNQAQYLSRERIFAILRERYNMKSNYQHLSKLVLPSSRASVNIVWTDAKDAIISLLTDPRIRANDYIFEGNDPFAPPPNLNYIGDLHTAKAYKKTYEKIITDPTSQILLPVVLYIDGAVTGQFSDHQITAVKFSLGIFNRKARDKAHMWRILGYIPPISKAKSRGERLLIDSMHMDATRARYEAYQNEGQMDGSEVHYSQDLHTMLEKVLKSLVKLQKEGFNWDLCYNDKVYKDVHFIPFVPFIKCDTDEADKLTGSYTNRTQFVSQLCRYCKCPTNRSDDPFAHYPPKTTAQIRALVNQKRLDDLQDLSQQYIHNACYALRFGLHNKQGVHGATPLEMLHAILLGLFKNLRNEFFIRLGDKSILAEEFDALAKLYGKLLSRQSCRDKPKTKFSNGIRKGKLMAKEYTGILLVMLVLLWLAKGRELVGQKAREFGPTFLQDWILCIETLLEWEQWLKSDQMLKKHVRAAQDRHRIIMYLVRKVAKRSEGMGLKLTKFHAILHIADDIANFGVPMEVDTGALESHHKETIRAAKLTQRVRSTFETQTAQRLMEVHLLELAQEEMKGRPLWDYHNGYYHPPEVAKAERQPTTGGAAFRIFEDGNGVCQISATQKYQAKYPRFMMDDAFLCFFNGLQEAVKPYYNEVIMLTYHFRAGHHFRANVAFRGTVWRDWVWVDWGPDGVLPCKIWGFVDLSQIPPNVGVSYGGLSNVSPGIYAIVECATVMAGDEVVIKKRKGKKDEHIVVPNETELVSRLEIDCAKIDGKLSSLRFYLADVEAFKAPAIVVPDVGGPENSYLALHDMTKWAQIFEEWLDCDVDLDEFTRCTGTGDDSTIPSESGSDGEDDSK